MNQPMLTDVELTSIGKELTDDGKIGKPTHPQLWHDIDKAMFVACNSPTFRAIVAREATKESK